MKTLKWTTHEPVHCAENMMKKKFCNVKLSFIYIEVLCVTCSKIGRYRYSTLQETCHPVDSPSCRQGVQIPSLYH